MALTLEAAVKVKSKCRAFFSKNPQSAYMLKGLFRALNDFQSNLLQLQFVAYGALGATDVVIADVAATLWAIYYKKPAGSTTDAVLKMMDHASAVTQATPDYAIVLKNADEQCLVWPQGQVFASGITIQSNMTSTGSTTSATADKPSGFFIIGA